MNESEDVLTSAAHDAFVGAVGVATLGTSIPGLRISASDGKDFKKLDPLDEASA